ncbi:MAG TPA: M23 family metallopeptidase [Methylomirabilota bacterium]|jgi:murein DD-endopeptidase MepM/ murein hydrolase activator NlpD|nr:M23 family metallopeptidase [Methylomirabilota bacterium]
MKSDSYTFFLASNRRGNVHKFTVPGYAVHFLAVLAIVGAVTVLGLVSSYSRMLWKVGNYNALRRQEDTLTVQYRQLQDTVKDTDQRLNSLQSLATEVAMTYGIAQLPRSPFSEDAAPSLTDTSFQRSVAEFQFLETNATAVGMANSSMHLAPKPGLGVTAFMPSIWPVQGPITGSFGERMDPFSGEGAFHTGVDIGAPYGNPVVATADGIVINAEEHMGYGRLVVVDHGFGVTTWYAHLSSLNATVGQQVKRGEVIGYVGVSGRATGPHVHYEVRINGAPVNPMRYLRSAVAAD